MTHWLDRIGQSDADTFTSLITKLGNNTTAFWAAIGYEGVTSLAAKLTAARAALLDQITALRMAELDAANIPTDIDTLLARLTALRAGYLDELAAANIPADVDTLLARLTAARAGYLDFLQTTEAAGPYSYLDVGGEQDVYENLVVTRRHVWVSFSNKNMTQTGTFRLYRKEDGATYDLYVAQAVLVAAGSERAFDAEFTTNQHWKLAYQENVDEGAARAIPYNVVQQVVE